MFMLFLRSNLESSLLKSWLTPLRISLHACRENNNNNKNNNNNNNSNKNNKISLGQWTDNINCKKEEIC